MVNNEFDVSLIEKIRRWWKAPREINVGDLGIFHEVVSFGTRVDVSNDLTYDVYVKIKAVEVYDNLVEIDVINIKIKDSVSQDIVNLITNNLPKYVNPKTVSWQIKKEDSK